MKAIIATTAGGPEVLEYTDVPEPTPGPAEVVVKVTAAGVNFIDTYRRVGMDPFKAALYDHAEDTADAT